MTILPMSTTAISLLTFVSPMLLKVINHSLLIIISTFIIIKYGVGLGGELYYYDKSSGTISIVNDHPVGSAIMHLGNVPQ